jgi:hypothetical protein
VSRDTLARFQGQKVTVGSGKWLLKGEITVEKVELVERQFDSKAIGDSVQH